MAAKDISGVSARQQAENELREDTREANVVKFKDKLRDLKAAKRVVTNIEADITELEEELEE